MKDKDCEGIVVTTGTTLMLGKVRIAFNKVTFHNGSVVVGFEPDTQVAESIEIVRAAREAIAEACATLKKRKNTADRKWVPDISKPSALPVQGIEPNLIRFQSTCVCG
ncbi:MAG: hypothetical protein ABIA11_03635 [Patescibacteria group bacterium]|nr:hypothetical protein [Patescibacteria group bacterium]